MRAETLSVYLCPFYVLTPICGSVLAYVFQSIQWRQQKKFELLQHQLREGKELAHEVTQLINRRFFALQRLFWAIQEKSANVEMMWSNYYADVVSWNQNLTSIKIRTRLFAGPKVAGLLIDDDDLSRELPKSVHYAMRGLHKRILDAKAGGEISEALARQIEREIANTNNTIQDFQNQLLDRLLRHVVTRD